MKRQTNKSKWWRWTYSLLIFLCGNAGPGKERNAVQAMGRLFQNRCFYSLTLRYKYFRIFPVHLQIALWNDFLYHLIRSLYLVNICMTGVYSGIQWNIYVKPFDIPLPPPCFHPTPVQRPNLCSLRPKWPCKALFLKMTKEVDHWHPALNISTGSQPNVVKISTLVKGTII